MKTKQSYAALPHVSAFIDWLATQLNSKTLFKHQYVDRRSGNLWSCDSLFGAYESYHWSFPGNARLGYNTGTCSASNAKALEALRQEFIVAGTDDTLVLQAAIDVMAWGGVTARNVEWLKANKVGLGRMIQGVQIALLQKDPHAPTLRSKALRFNAGMTKVYSLICPDFVIYDSRVAAALGLLVVRYCEAKGLSQVPDALCFPWSSAKESENAPSPKRRNPSTGTLQFKRLRAGAHHALWNMRANWVLSQVIAHGAASQSPFHQIDAPANALRGLEQALFMMGYDLGHTALTFNN